MNSLTPLLWKQFKIQRDEYLKLMAEANRTETEIAKVIERLGLLRRLLRLDGREVKLPAEVEDRSAKGRRKAA